MSFLRRLVGGPPAPPWASFMRGDEYRAFMAALGDHFAARGQRFRVEGDGLYVESPSGGEETYGLSNLAQLCHQLDRADWPLAIETHFRNLEEASTSDVDLADPEVARPYLKARVYRRSDMPPDAVTGLVTMPLTADLVGVLVYDLPTSVRTVSRDTARDWPDAVDRLFAIALEHLSAEVGTYERARIELETGGTVTGLSAPSFFVASQVLRLGDELSDAPNGALVAMPNRHGLFWHPIVAAAPTLAAVRALLPIAHRLHEDGPGSLTPELHWWHRGALTPLPSRIDGTRIEFAPPDAFTQLLRSLGDAS
ncbi:MAG TPA: hypothetical protein VFK54_08125 [Candidatus Limnocylindrales bacterium]|nr:hypothetical protein [Candidatus Limnocylindrales bacterium]